MIKKLAEYGLDLLALLGASAVVYGVAQIHAPAAYIVAGAGVVTLSIIRARRWDS